MTSEQSELVNGSNLTRAIKFTGSKLLGIKVESTIIFAAVLNILNLNKPQNFISNNII